MKKEEIISEIASQVKTRMALDGGAGHDWQHIQRVWNNTKLICKTEECDQFVAELGALLHDIADYKFHGGDEEIGGKTARAMLLELDVESGIIDAVVHIVDNISFKGGGENKIKTDEGRIVQDADRLDSIGAIGIARCFTYGGGQDREIYNPDHKPNLNMTKEEYKNNKGPSINHFYEKLLTLKDKMNTKTGKELAESRHDFMQKYLDQFFAEVNGEK